MKQSPAFGHRLKRAPHGSPAACVAATTILFAIPAHAEILSVDLACARKAVADRRQALCRGEDQPEPYCSYRRDLGPDDVPLSLAALRSCGVAVVPATDSAKLQAELESLRKDVASALIALQETGLIAQSERNSAAANPESAGATEGGSDPPQ